MITLGAAADSRGQAMVVCGAWAAIVLAFGAAIQAPFHFDDHSLLADPRVTSPGGWRDLIAAGQTRPLSYLSFWLNYQLGGSNPAGYHVFNLAAHMAATAVMWSCASGLLSRLAALIATVVFAIHPVQTEPVAYIFARGSILSALFCLLSLRAWLRGKVWQPVIWFAVGLAAKEECAAFPVVLWMAGRAFGKTVDWRSLAMMGALSAAAVMRVAVMAAVTQGSGAGPQAGIGPLDYFATQGWAILRYLQLLALPIGFSIEPGITVIRDWRALLCWTSIAVLGAVAWRSAGQGRAGFWFLAGLVLLAPTSSLFPAADLAADRRMYLPMIAFAPMLGRILERTNYPVLLAAGALLYGMLSFSRTEVWRTEAALWEDAMRWAPDKVRPRIQLARVSEPRDGLELLLEAKRLAPDDPAVATELGRIHLEMGQAGEALSEFGRAVAAKPRDALARNNRGVALAALGMKDHARADFRSALEFEPCLFDARLNLLKAGERTGLPGECRFTREQVALWSQ